MRKFIFLLFFLFLSSQAYPQHTQNPPLQVTDGATTVFLPWEITFSGATVADDGDGSATVTITGGAEDNIQVNGVAATDLNFIDNDIVWTLSTGPSPDTITGTVGANAVALSTDTTGNYVAAIIAGNGLDSTGASTGENITHTLSLDLMTATNGVGTTNSASGMEFVSGEVSILQGCSDEQTLTWEENDDSWHCDTAAGAGDITDVFSCSTGDCNNVTVASGETLTFAAGSNITAQGTFTVTGTSDYSSGAIKLGTIPNGNVLYVQGSLVAQENAFNYSQANDTLDVVNGIIVNDATDSNSDIFIVDRASSDATASWDETNDELDWPFVINTDGLITTTINITNSGTANALTFTGTHTVTGTFNFDNTIEGKLILAASTTLPSKCITGQVYWDTDADTNGSLYGCRTQDTWKDVDDDGGGTGTDTHVMFFDGADTPAGDAGMTYNKTTNVLTLTGSVVVADEAYDATDWNGETDVPTKNAVRDKIEGDVILSGEIDTTAELETIQGGVNILLETEIDASSELLAIMDDETGSASGSPLLVFNQSPVIDALDVNGTLSVFGTTSIHNQKSLRFYEASANGVQYAEFKDVAARTTTAVCTFENDSSFIPDSCVGDGTDNGGSEVNNLETITTGIASTEILIGTAADTGVYAALKGDATMTSGGTITVVNDLHDHTSTSISGIDISADTNLTAGDALTITDDDIDFDGGASPGGELGGTWGTPTIDDSITLNTLTLGGTITITSTTGTINAANGGIILPNAATLPANCQNNETFVDNNATSGQRIYLCESGTWVLQGDGGGSASGKEFWWPAGATLPLETADSIPPISKDAGTNIDQLPVDFNDSTDECRTVSFKVPATINSGGTATFYAHWYSAAATSGDIIFDLRHNSGVAEGVDPDQALTTEASAADAAQGTAGMITITSWTETMSNLAWAAGDQVDAEFCRDANHASDTLVGDMRATGFGILVP